MNINNSLGYNPSEIYERIKKLFRDNGMKDTQDEISKFLDISQKTVSLWKNNIPSSDVLIQIANKFNISLDWLVYGNTPTDPPVQAAYKALTAISEFAQLNISVVPMTKEENDGFIYTPYKMNIEITPKFYELHNDDWQYAPPEYAPPEWYYYMDIENYKLAWLLHDWHSFYKTSMSNNEKQIAYDNLLDRINGLHNRPASLVGISCTKVDKFLTLCNTHDINRENNTFLSLSDYTPPKTTF